MRLATRAAVLATGACCLASCVAGNSTAGVGNLGPADTTSPIPVSGTRSVAVAFTTAKDGQLSTVKVVASRSGLRPIGLLAYLVTPNDPRDGGRPSAPAATGGGEPGCWGSVSDSALTTAPKAVTINGYACRIKAGQTYWIQFGTAMGGANLYTSRDKRTANLATQPYAGAGWARSYTAGAVEVVPVVR